MGRATYSVGFTVGERNDGRNLSNVKTLNERGGMQSKVEAMKRLQSDTAAKFRAPIPSILDKAFKRAVWSHGWELMDLRE